jgi:DNA-binding transcriptional LysR family regulator
LGVKLFDRSGHKPELTAEGRALLSDAKAILIKVEAMRARARGLGVGVELALSIAVDPIVPMTAIAAALEELRIDYPTVGMRIEIAPMGAALHVVVNRRSMLAVTTSQLHDAYIEAEALGSLPPLIAVCSAKHPLAAEQPGRPWTGAELAEHRQIVVTDPSPMTEGQDFGVLSPGTWRVSDLSMKYALILAGSGWGNLPEWMVERDLEEGRLARVSAAALGARSETGLTAYLLRRLDVPLGPAAKSLRQMLLSQFGRLRREKVAVPIDPIDQRKRDR